MHGQAGHPRHPRVGSGFLSMANLKSQTNNQPIKMNCWASFGCLPGGMGCGGRLVGWMLMLGVPVYAPARHTEVHSGFFYMADLRGQTHNQPIK